MAFFQLHSIWCIICAFSTLCFFFTFSEAHEKSTYLRNERTLAKKPITFADLRRLISFNDLFDKMWDDSFFFDDRKTIPHFKEFLTDKDFDSVDKQNKFTLTHPNDDECQFLLEWQDVLAFNDTQVSVDVPNRMLKIKYDHEYKDNQMNNSYSRQVEQINEYISEGCLVNQDVVDKKLAGYAVDTKKKLEDDKLTNIKVKIWFPKDTNYNGPKMLKNSKGYSYSHKSYDYGTPSTKSFKTVNKGTYYYRNASNVSNVMNKKLNNNSNTNKSDANGTKQTEVTYEESSNENNPDNDQNEFKNEVIETNQSSSDNEETKSALKGDLPLYRAEWKEEL